MLTCHDGKICKRCREFKVFDQFYAYPPEKYGQVYHHVMCKACTSYYKSRRLDLIAAFKWKPPVRNPGQSAGVIALSWLGAVP